MEGIDIFIVDDNEEVGSLVVTYLAELGYRCKQFPDGRELLEAVARHKPRLVIMDVMMPGMDGLTLCQQLRSAPGGGALKIVLASSKAKEEEEGRALKAGADAFFSKPFDLETLGQGVRMWAGEPGGPPEGRAAAVRVGIWGCRGYSPKPMGPSVFGRRTSCVSVQSASGETLILDGGSGLEACGEALSTSKCPDEIIMLLTHYHPDHVEGLGSFALAGRPGLTLKVAGPKDVERGIESVVPLLAAGGPPRAAVRPYSLYESGYQLSKGGARLQVLYAHHPTTTLAFSLLINDRKIVYCPDSELDESDEVTFSNNTERVVRFATGADLFIHNGYYAPEHRGKAQGSGHSSWPAVLRVAARANVRRLLLTHMRAEYDDERLARLEQDARAAAQDQRLAFDCSLAREGASLEIP